MVQHSPSSLSPGVSPYQLFPAVACYLSLMDDRFTKKSYEGYEVLRVNITTEPAYEALKNVYLGENFDFWSPPNRGGAPTDVLVSPDEKESLRYLLHSIGAQYSVLDTKIQENIQFERYNAVSLRQGASAMNWNSYQSAETIHAWMDQMAEQYPALVTVTNYGKSTEGRDMKVMKISTAGPESNRSAVWLDGGIHAREWVTPATVTYIANELILQATRKRNTRLTDNLDWYIAPLMNPDGYAFTMAGDRLWRKTRSIPTKETSFGGLFGCCKGADPNRNWDAHWGGKGTSKNQCSQIYHGPSPASEPEVASSQNFILEHKDSIKLFLTMHSYSQLILLPWGWDGVRTDDHDELMRVANKAASALQKHHGTQYRVGATPELLYPAAGGSFDWAKEVAGIRYSYGFELRDTGRFGFLLPPSQIIPTGEETFSAVKSMAEDVMAVYRIGVRQKPGGNVVDFFNENEKVVV